MEEMLVNKLQKTEYSVLVVDDDPNIRDLLSYYLKSIGGYKVTSLEDGARVLDLLRKENIDCIFLDLKMPKIGGLEILSRIKAYDQTIPVIMVTGYPSMEVAIRALKYGASDFLIKPFSLKEVKISLEKALRERELIIKNVILTYQLSQKREVERLNRALRKKIREQKLLFEISEKISKIQEFDELYTTIVDLTAYLLNVNKVIFLLYNQEENLIHPITYKGIKPRQLSDSYSCEEYIIKEVIDNGKPYHGIATNNYISLCNLIKDIGWNQEEIVCWPFKIRDQIFGLLLCGDKKRGENFQKTEFMLLDFLEKKSTMAIENIALYDNIIMNLYDSLRALVSTIEAKDTYTKEHSTRVTRLSKKIAIKMGLSQEHIDSINFAGYLHDIGKIGIRDEILTKEDKLTPEEWEQIKQHPVIGERIVQHLGLLPEEKAIIRHHHERWDGNGYPDGLKGEEIPLLSRIITVADAFDAMTSHRSYRPAKSIIESANELQLNSGTQFDPEIVKVFLEEVFPSISKNLSQKLSIDRKAKRYNNRRNLRLINCKQSKNKKVC